MTCLIPCPSGKNKKITTKKENLLVPDDRKVLFSRPAELFGFKDKMASLLACLLDSSFVLCEKIMMKCKRFVILYRPYSWDNPSQVIFTHIIQLFHG